MLKSRINCRIAVNKSKKIPLQHPSFPVVAHSHYYLDSHWPSGSLKIRQRRIRHAFKDAMRKNSKKPGQNKNRTRKMPKQRETTVLSAKQNRPERYSWHRPVLTSHHPSLSISEQKQFCSKNTATQIWTKSRF